MAEQQKPNHTRKILPFESRLTGIRGAAYLPLEKDIFPGGVFSVIGYDCNIALRDGNFQQDVVQSDLALYKLARAGVIGAETTVHKANPAMLVHQLRSDDNNNLLYVSTTFARFEHDEWVSQQPARQTYVNIAEQNGSLAAKIEQPDHSPFLYFNPDSFAYALNTSSIRDGNSVAVFAYGGDFMLGLEQDGEPYAFYPGDFETGLASDLNQLLSAGQESRLLIIPSDSYTTNGALVIRITTTSTGETSYVTMDKRGGMWGIQSAQSVHNLQF